MSNRHSGLNSLHWPSEQIYYSGERMSGPKKSFDSAVAGLVAQFGHQISSKNILAYCRENNVSVPLAVRSCKIGRGWYDLTPLLNASQNNNVQMPTSHTEIVREMTDEEVEQDINSRFASLDLMTYGVIDGKYRSLIVSGNPGTGKTFTLEMILESAANKSKILYTGVRGYVRATGLYRLMWEHRHEQCVLLMDDADSIFQDEISLNLLKGGLDTTKRRHISWRSEKIFESADGENIPQEFDFHGAIIFVSNIDFQRSVAQGNKLAVHLAALMSRSYYLDLNLLSVRELIVRIKSVVEHSGILKEMGINKKDQVAILDYIIENQNRIRELSLRTVTKMGMIWTVAAGNQDNFTKMASATCMVRGR